MSSTKKMINLKSSDDDSFEVEELVALESQTIKHMIEDLGADDSAIPLPNVTSIILAKVIEYYKRHVGAASKKSSEVSSSSGGGTSADDKKSSTDGDTDLKAFDAEFVKVDSKTLFYLILAVNYLDIKSLLDLTCKTVADMNKDMSGEEVRKGFNITNDLNKEEVEAVRNENSWAFEK